jgi:hypothetical protein
MRMPAAGALGLWRGMIFGEKVSSSLACPALPAEATCGAAPLSIPNHVFDLRLKWPDLTRHPLDDLSFGHRLTHPIVGGQDVPIGSAVDAHYERPSNDIVGQSRSSGAAESARYHSCTPMPAVSVLRT